MDIQRTLIIVGLAIVSYLMILQWQEDYGSQVDSATSQINSQSYPQVESEGGLDIPEPSMQGNSDSDVPVVSTPAAQTTPAQSSTTLPTRQFVEVQTDVVHYVIDLKGGDIVSVELNDYAVSTDQPDVPYRLLEKSPVRTYIAQSGLVGPQGPDSSRKGRPVYSSPSTHYSLEPDAGVLNVDLQLTQENGARITKRFRFERGNYDVDIQYIVENQGTQSWAGAVFGQIKRDGSPDPSQETATGFGLPTFLGAAYWDTEKPYNKLDLESIEEQPLNKSIPGGWMAFLQHYFISVWIPDQQQTNQYWAKKGSDGFYKVGFSSPVVSVSPGQSHTFSAKFYAGPKTLKNLESLVENKGLDLAIDYGPLFFISKPLFHLLEFFHNLTSNWGLAIILLTFTVKAAFFWLSAKSYRSMANMRKVQPKLMALKEQYGDDRQRMSQELMKLYRDEKINPLGGCLPMLVQMPVFLALYWALLESVELRHAPFYLWINDLSVMDPYFVLPLIMGATMYIQQLLNPAPPDPMQARMMKMMPIIFTVFFLWFPAGLVLYWVTNNTLSIAQQWYITRAIEKGEKA